MLAFSDIKDKLACNYVGRLSNSYRAVLESIGAIFDSMVPDFYPRNLRSL